MQQYLEILQTCRLFAEIPPDSLKTMLECFAPTIQTYAKQQTLLQAGEPLHQLGIVLTGKVQLGPSGLRRKPQYYCKSVTCTAIRGGICLCWC